MESDDGFSSVDSYRLRIEQLQAEVFALDEIKVYPNPFLIGDSAVTFAYQLSASQIADNIRLEIFISTGNLVYSETRETVGTHGKFEWHAVTRNGRPLAPGIYIYRISATQADVLVQEIGKLSILK